MIDSIYRKDENYYPKVLLEKYYFIEDTEIYCSNYDEEYYICMYKYYEYYICINLFLERLKKQEIFLAFDFKVPS